MRRADAGDEVVVISSSVKLECQVGPLREDDLVLADHYRAAFERFRVAEAGVAGHERAAEPRARQGLRVPDSIHLAVAQLSGCRELWTNDARLSAASRGLAIDVTEGR